MLQTLLMEKRTDAPDTCQVCDELIQPEDRSKYRMFSYNTLHKKCWAALQSLQRMGSSDAELRTKLVDARSANEDMFKLIAQSLVTARGRTRSDKQRDGTRKYVSDMSYENAVTRRKGILLLDRRAFIAYHVYTRGFDKVYAETAWAKALANPRRYKEQENGKTVIAVEKSTELIHDERLARRQSTTSKETYMRGSESFKKLMSASKKEAIAREFGRISGGAFDDGAAADEDPSLSIVCDNFIKCSLCWCCP